MTGYVPADAPTQRLDDGGAPVPTSAPVAARGRVRNPFKAQHPRHRLVVIACQILTIVVLLLAWQFAAGSILPASATSRPSEVWHSLVTYLSGAQGWTDIRNSLGEFAVGYSLGVCGGIVVGLLLGSFQFLGRVFQPFVAALNSVPMVAIAPLLLVVFGLGLWSKAVISALIVFFLLFYNTYLGRLGVSKGLVNSIQVMGGGRLAQIRYVVLPSMFPGILAGMRAGVAFAMIGVVVGEFVASAAGVGYHISNAGQLFDTAGTMAGIVVLMLIVSIGTVLVSLLQRWLLRWQRA